jgi:hypothetical protein
MRPRLRCQRMAENLQHPKGCPLPTIIFILIFELAMSTWISKSENKTSAASCGHSRPNKVSSTMRQAITKLMATVSVGVGQPGLPHLLGPGFKSS